mgnify:CR=1 FL=1
MKSDKYAKSVALLCPTCGCTDFEGADNEANELVTCASCGREITHNDLLHENSENIAAHVDDISKQVVNDMAKELSTSLKKVFHGSKFIKIK